MKKVFVPALAFLLSFAFTLLSFFLSNLFKGKVYPDQITQLGWPVPFYHTGGFTGETGINLINLIVDLVFWFLIALILIALILEFFPSIKKK